MREFDPGRITERRQQLGITRAKLAECADISRTHVYDVEGGRSVPTVRVIARLAYVLRVREGFFFVDSVSYKKRTREKEGVHAR